MTREDSDLHQRQQADSENWDLLHFALKHWEPPRNLQTHTCCKSHRRMESRKKWFGVPIRACSFWTYFLAWRISENLFASIYCTMFRALQHDFGLLLAFFHQQDKRKCSNVFQACHHPCGRNGWRTVAKSNLNFAAFSHVLLLVFLTCFSRTELMNISFHLEAKFEKKLHQMDNFLLQMFGVFPPHLPNLANLHQRATKWKVSKDKLNWP